MLPIRCHRLSCVLYRLHVCRLHGLFKSSSMWHKSVHVSRTVLLTATHNGTSGRKSGLRQSDGTILVQGCGTSGIVPLLHCDVLVLMRSFGGMVWERARHRCPALLTAGY